MLADGVRSVTGRLLAPPLRLLGLELRRKPGARWDPVFRDWVRRARASGRDVNDIGDEAWEGEAAEAAERLYLPHVTPDAVVLELGPGTGRYTRHVIGSCKRMILVDSSAWVCRWLEGYLRGKGAFETHYIEEPRMPGVESASVDFAFANGVFEHVDLDEACWLLEELYRVLRPGGRIAFNFVTIMTDAGLRHFRRFQRAPGEPNVFRYQHPQAMTRLVEAAGFGAVTLCSGPPRVCHLQAVKPPSPGAPA